jgi:hypothetical protein
MFYSFDAQDKPRVRCVLLDFYSHSASECGGCSVGGWDRHFEPDTERSPPNTRPDEKGRVPAVGTICGVTGNWQNGIRETRDPGTLMWIRKHYLVLSAAIRFRNNFRLPPTGAYQRVARETAKWGLRAARRVSETVLCATPCPALPCDRCQLPACGIRAPRSVDPPDDWAWRKCHVAAGSICTLVESPAA